MTLQPSCRRCPSHWTTSKFWDGGIDWPLAGERAARFEREAQLLLALELLKVANECMAEAFEGKSVSPTMAVMFIRKLDASGLLGEIGGTK